MALYPQNQKPFSEALFQDPTSEYRGTPFWAWNHHLDEGLIRKQVHMFKEMGMGGYHAHVRTGLDTPYLGPEFMDRMAAALDEAKKEGLLHWLYDEDRWPSGPAGGIVTKNTAYAQKKLLFTPFPKESVPWQEGMVPEHGVFYELAGYRIELENGLLKDYQRTEEDGEWKAYLCLEKPQEWWNDQGYADTLKKEAIEEFIRVTHDAYAARFQEDFGGAIPAIFTDEPQFLKKQTLTLCEEKQEISIPYTDDLEKTFTEAYGSSLLDHLPELFWERADGEVSLTRYHYHDHVCERFASAFADTCGKWTKEHGLLLTGHMMEEPTLTSQTAMLGEAMRSYRGFGLPGIDMLCDRREYTTAKQAQSASRQMGCPGVVSELYGVTNWDFDFRGHKLQGDWQAALGVTTRVPHLTWMSMEGEAKRDYPASIGYQSPWYKEYKFVEDHFARVNTAMTRGKAKVRIGVIHPIESYWLYYGSNEKTGSIREEMDEQFQNLNRWLLFDCLDFDYISEALLENLDARPELIAEEGPGFKAGCMRYDVIVVPDLKTIRSSTLERLEAFRNNNGAVIFLGQAPAYVDAVRSDRAVRLADRCRMVPFVRTRILEALKPFRDVEVLSLSGHATPDGRCEKGMHTNHVLYQYRKDEDREYLFLAHGTRMLDPDQPAEETIEVRLKGLYTVKWMDTLTGNISEISSVHADGHTVLRVRWYEHDSLLLELLPTTKETHGEAPVLSLGRETGKTRQLPLPAKVKVSLSEPNALVLDMAEYRLDGEPWQEEEEILRIDKKIRTQLGYPLRQSQSYQPYMMKETPGESVHRLELKYTIRVERPACGLKLALENRRQTEVYLDEKQVDISERKDYYTDVAIETVAFPDLSEGEHTLRLCLPFHRKTNLEWSYLLGDFGVRVEGRRAYITAPVRELPFGDWTCQGLPFYGGNVTYHLPVCLPEAGKVTVEATQFRTPLWKVRCGGEGSRQPFSPYAAVLKLPAGENEIELTAFGSRINTFGQIHNCHETMDWFGADSWRTEGPAWSYEYHLHRAGILKSPEVYLS